MAIPRFHLHGALQELNAQNVVATEVGAGETPVKATKCWKRSLVLTAHSTDVINAVTLTVLKR